MVLHLPAQAQTGSDFVKVADRYFAQGDYYNAAVYYEKYLSAGKSKTQDKGYNPYVAQKQNSSSSVKASNRQQATYKLAESYRLLNNYAKAVPYYQQATTFDSVAFPLAYYWYGISLRATASYEEAEAALNKFLGMYTAAGNYKASATKEIANLVFIRQQLSSKAKQKIEVGKAPASLNPTGANYAPAYQQNTLVFTSTRPDSTELTDKKNPYNNRLYKTTGNNVTKLNIPNAGKSQLGVSSFSADGNTLFFTKWQQVNGKNLAAIYTATKQDTGWGNITLLDSLVNTTGYSSQQPYITADGSTLFFASDKPGGQGKFDLWYVPLSNNKPSAAAINLGTSINTADDEQAPFYHTPTATLVFSSKGFTGMGGYDLFYSKGITGNWQAPVNLGAPANSVKDDIYFAAKGKSIWDSTYFSSDRASECCLELFTALKLPVDKYIYGNIVNCVNRSPLPGASVQVLDTTFRQTLYSLTSDYTGKYAFTIHEGQSFIIISQKERYTVDTSYYSYNSLPETDTVYNNAICLTPVKDTVPPPVIVLNKVYFDFDKHNLTSQSKKTLDSVLSVMQNNPAIIIEVNGHTDAEGSDIYNLNLSMQRAKVCAYYLIGKGIKAARIQIKASGESQPVAPNQATDGKDNPDGRKLNRRTEFIIIQR
jgi:outer membrane protein OmpA-like peptidoglycan-associated protein/tetratricopeptide (TPR) repeat protein